MPKKAKSLLIVSAVLNVILFGFIIWGCIYHAQVDGQRWAVVKDQLGPEVRHQVSRQLQQLQKKITSAERKEEKARKKLIGVMGARSFKEDAYDKAVKAFEEAREVSADMKATGYKALLSELAREDRSKMAEHLVRHYEGSDQELRSDLAKEIEANKKASWWNLNRYVSPKPDAKPAGND